MITFILVMFYLLKLNLKLDKVARELVLDTETTGLDYENGHRIVEIGIVELENHIPTGDFFIIT